MVCITAVLLNVLLLMHNHLCLTRWLPSIKNTYLIHCYGITQMCVLWWLTSLKFVVKELSQWLHWFGLSLVCFLVTNQISICNKIFVTVIASIWLLSNVFACGLPDYHLWKKIYHSNCIVMVYHQCMFFCKSPGYHLWQNISQSLKQYSLSPGCIYWSFCSWHLCIKALSKQLH